ncbi:MAG: hypothetical protein KC589_01515 [Nanoarchaeota archaeon]|nr:hypothetical protein [Nanoarchaeota archaeon]
MDVEILKEIGLHESEIKVYLSLLKLKETTVTKITQDNGLHRTHIYDILEKLLAKGMVGYVIKNNVKYFSAANPSRLFNFFKEKEERLTNTIIELEKYQQNNENNPVNVELYKGIEGFKTIINDLIKDGNDYYLFGKLEFEEIVPFYVIKAIKEIEERGIKETAIIEEGSDLIKIKNGKYRWLSKKYLLPNTTVIYGNKVGQFIWEKPYYAILIKSKDVANSYKTQFDLLWEKAQEKL